MIDTHQIVYYKNGILKVSASHGREGMQGRTIVRNFLLDLYTHKSFETIDDLSTSDTQNLAGLIMHYSEDFNIDPTEAWGNHDKTSQVATLLSQALITGDKYSNSVFLEDIKKMFADYYLDAMKDSVTEFLSEINDMQDNDYFDHHDYSDLEVTISGGN